MKDGPLNNSIIQLVADHIIKWEKFSRYLELSDSEVETIKRDHSQENKRFNVSSVGLKRTARMPPL